MKTEPTINIQDEVVKIHAQYGMTEMANYHIEKLFEKYVEQSSPKVKQLEWEEGDFCFRSITKFGQYTISKPTSLRGRQVFVVYFNEIYIKSWNTPEEAKDFVQKDFEKRVKECLITE